jgi:hypothetical protein
MNLRIRELAEQAGCTIDGMGYGEGNVEKFAELIVADCINMIEAEAKNADEDDVHGMRNAAGLIGRAFITIR